MKKIYIAAGGTGGHINAALSLGEEYFGKYDVIYITGKRYLDYQLFENKNSIHLNSRPLRSKNPFIIIKNLIINFWVFLGLFSLFLKNNPDFIIGAGGYVCGPSLLCAKLLGKRVFIIEQNAVVGLTNKILSKFSNIIFTNFKTTKGLEKISPNKIMNLGNPIRKNIVFSENIIGDEIKILVFGGSLGAEQINHAIHKILDQKFSKKVIITHQVGKNNLDPSVLGSENIEYKQIEYIEDMNKEYKESNIIIARAGASTISELRVIKKPSILIPYPAATDNHQYHNAINLKEENNFFVDILDHTIENSLLADRLVIAIESIISKKQYYTKDSVTEVASVLIANEIETYVRN